MASRGSSSDVVEWAPASFPRLVERWGPQITRLSININQYDMRCMDRSSIDEMLTSLGACMHLEQLTLRLWDPIRSLEMLALLLSAVTTPTHRVRSLEASLNSRTAPFAGLDILAPWLRHPCATALTLANASCTDVDALAPRLARLTRLDLSASPHLLQALPTRPCMWPMPSLYLYDGKSAINVGPLLFPLQPTVLTTLALEGAASSMHTVLNAIGLFPNVRKGVAIWWRSRRR